MHGFWAGGAEAYEDFLEQDYRDRKRDLQHDLTQATTDPERLPIEEQMRALDAEYQSKLRDVLWCLF